jgi:hypothetical protein
MAADLEDLASLEGHTFIHEGQTYEVVTVTATRKTLEEVSRGTDARVHMHFTVTRSGESTPIGPTLELDPDHANDLEYVKAALEDAVAHIVDGKMPPRTGAYL